MRGASELITAARLLSRNTANSDGTLAITDNEILQYLNDAQDRVQNLISAKKNIAKIFVTQTIISLVADQEAYSIPDRVLLNKQIENVEYSYDGSLGNYSPLEKLNFFNRNTYSANYPMGYFKRGGQIFLQPPPASSIGTLRVTYERDLDDLDISRGVISAIGSGTSTQFATVTLSSAADAYEPTTPGWSNTQYASFVDVFGVRKCFNVLLTSYNTGTNLLTPNPTPFIYSTSDSALAVGDVAVFGKYMTTHSQLPDSCERYLIHSAAADLLNRDSSNDYSKQVDKVAEIEEDVLRALAAQTSELQYIPQIDPYDW